MTHLSVQRPSTLDVTQSNPRSVLYVTSDNTVVPETGDSLPDGSIRFSFTPGDPNAAVEVKQGGQWNITGLNISDGSLEIGRNMQLQATADFIKTGDPSGFDVHSNSLIPHIPLSDLGTGFVHTPVTNLVSFTDLFKDPVSEVAGTVLTQAYSITGAFILKAIILQAGTLSATADLQLKIHKGTDNTGYLMYRRNLSKDQFIANNPVQFDFNLDLGFSSNHVAIFIEITSADSFSLETDVGGNLITQISSADLRTIDILTEGRVINDELQEMVNVNLEPLYAGAFS